MRTWRLSDRNLTFPPPVGAGIVNVTDDSFFSGARSGTPERAVEDGLALVAAGFELLDVGAVAARSGAEVPADEEAAKLVPAVGRLAAETGVPVLADTFSAEVARAVLDAGAAAINDISGGGDPAMLELVAERGCGYVLMHIEGPPRVDRAMPTYDHVVDHVKGWFEERIEAAVARGVDAEQIAIDPGLDFDLTTDDDLELLRRIGELRELGRPVFMALSRKDFLGAVLAGSWVERAAAEDRGPATMAAAALAAAAGVEVFRLHDSEALDAMRVGAAIAGPATVSTAVRRSGAKPSRAAVEAPDA
jgi:dihydropteroate synthase